MGSMCKICNSCGQEKPLSAFNKNRALSDGYKSRCRECDAASFQEKYANPEWRAHHNHKTKQWRVRLKDANPTRLWASDALANAKMRAKRSGVPCSINLLDVMGAVVDTCPLLGLPLIYATGRIHDNSPTLDRKIGDRGYTKDNIGVVSHRANRLKSDASVEELQTLLNNLVQYLNSD